MYKSNNQRKCIIDIETTDYEPWIGRIKVIGIKNLETNEIKQFFHKDEEKLIINFLQHHLKENYNAIIGYNINYDIRYICGRCLKYEINCKKLLTTPRIDIMSILKGPKNNINYNKPGRLQEWVQSTGLIQKLNQRESIKNNFYNDKTKEILKHNKDDLINTELLWKRIKKITGVIEEQIFSSKKNTPSNNYIYNDFHTSQLGWCDACEKVENIVKDMISFFVFSFEKTFDIIDLFAGGGALSKAKRVLLKKFLITKLRIMCFLQGRMKLR